MSASRQLYLREPTFDCAAISDTLGRFCRKKSEYRLGSIFSAPWARFSDADAGGLIIYPRLNGASSKSICDGS